MELGAPIEELEASSCPMCRLFASVAPQSFNSTTPLDLRAFSASKVFTGISAAIFQVHDATVLGVVKRSHLAEDAAHSRPSDSLERTWYLSCTQQPDRRSLDFGFRLICPESFSVEFVRNCMIYCQAKHGEACKQKTTESTLSPFFKVIDCKTRRVVIAPPNCQYAALSYVWGEHEQTGSIVDNGNEGSPLDGCPKVISDSVECAIKLNIRYLWVDRFCIDQLNAHEKHVQISQMDLIYAKAQVTIISATRNPDDGLPGVAGVLRKDHPHLYVHGRVIASTLPDPQTSVRSSKWVTRGWTYQEGLLSRRRLIFTDQQVFFECNSMHCAESLVLPLDSIHDKKTKMFRKHVPDGPLGLKSLGTDPYEIMSYISAFCIRRLTFPEDRINAMRGIFHVFEAGSLPVHQLMGVPILPYHLNSGNSYEMSKTPEQGFLIGLTWSHLQRGRRITHFPTWSWAGWSGTLEPEVTFDRTWQTSLQQMKVWIERENGTLSQFPSLKQLRNASPQEPLGHQRFIHLDAYTFSCSTVQLDEKELQRHTVEGDYWSKPTFASQYVKIEREHGSSYYMRVKLDRELEEHELSEKPLTGIIIGDFSDYLIHYVAIIIVEEFDGYAERLAISQDLHDLAGQDRGKFRTWARENAKRRTIKLG